MLKRLILFLVVLFLCCSCTPNKQEEITFSSWGSVSETKIIKSLISEYERENPDIKIRFLHIPQNYFQKIHLLFASSTPPDVIFINNLYLPVYAGKLLPLENIINKEEFFDKSYEALSYEGHIYAVPRDISVLVFYYNKNITGEINPNWSFEDFIRLVKKSENKNYWGVSYERNIFMAEPYTLTMGFDEGIKFYKSLEGKYAPAPSDIGSSTLAQMFLDEKLGLYLSGRWMFPKISEQASFPFGVVVFPGKVYADASGWAIAKESKNKEEAIKFVKFLSSEKSIDYFTKTGLIVPARKDSARLVNENAFFNAVKKSSSRKGVKDYNKQRDYLNKTLFD